MTAREDASLIGYARGALLEAASGAQDRIWLASPYVTRGVATEIAKTVAGLPRSVEMRLFTELTERSVRARVLDPKALLSLSKAGFEIIHLEGLHAKVSLVDGWGLVGSGNLTDSGLGKEAGDGAQGQGNVELGVVLSPSQIAEAGKRMEHWRRMGVDLPDAEIERFEGLDPYPRPAVDVKIANGSVRVTGTARIRELLAEPAPPGRAYWLDPNYHDYADEGWWRRRRWVSDRRNVGIKVDDLMVIYLAGKDGGPKKCPAVVRALGPAEEKPDFLRRERDEAAAGRWPWVTSIEVIGDVPADDGVSLGAIGTTGRSLQGGPRKISWEEFKTLAECLVRAV